MIALVVSLQVHEHKLDEFLDAIKENAERSFRDEVGCEYLDVTQDREDPLHSSSTSCTSTRQRWRRTAPRPTLPIGARRPANASSLAAR